MHQHTLSGHWQSIFLYVVSLDGHDVVCDLKRRNVVAYTR